MLMPCSDWPGMSHMPISGPAAVVGSTQARWAENGGGWIPKGDSGEGEQELGWLEHSLV